MEKKKSTEFYRERTNDDGKHNLPLPIPLSEEDEDQFDVYPSYTGYLLEDGVEVRDEEEISKIYYNGFFGKGSLSRGAPTYKERRLRYEENKRLKKLQNQPNEASDISKPLKELDSKSKDSEVQSFENINNNFTNSDDEFEDILDSDKEDFDEEFYYDPNAIETLRLSWCEAFYLSFCLGCLHILTEHDDELDLLSLWQIFCKKEEKFPFKYAAYHRLRTKNWVIKSGAKFGGDFALYEGSPQKYHSSYVVKVIVALPNGDSDSNFHPSYDWTYVSALTRTNINAGKEVLFALVFRPNEIDVSAPQCLNKMAIREMLMRRFVPSEERQED